MSTEHDPELQGLLEYLKRNRGFDFTGYKTSSLTRRVQKRMAEVQIGSCAEYMDYLEVHPNEFVPLFNTVLINVTGFFRDPPAWEFLARQVLAPLVESKGEGGGVRIWSAGCATGQEAYTIAMLLGEAMGEEALRQRVKIYATDADEEALAEARHGAYDERQAADVPPELRGRYFESASGRLVFRPDLRRSLIFGRHDLVQDAAISRIDLLICRNTLMYFNVEAQAKILARFHFALNRGGYLFLGKAETLLSHGDMFRPVDLKYRVFQRTPTAAPRDRLLAIMPLADGGGVPNGVRQVRLREAAFESGPVAQIVVDRKGRLALANEAARRLFGLGAADLGRPFQDLEVSYRPAELRSVIEEVYVSRAGVRLPDVSHPAARGERMELEVRVTPLAGEAGTVLGASIIFADQTQAKQLRNELERANQELETAYEELQSANEELETTNEELQSTVEELETTNEELQSANEELETMNEELQSTNEELRSMNDQLQQRSEEVHQLNGFLESVLGGLRAAVVVLDGDGRVGVWSKRAEDLWGLRTEETLGRPFFDLRIGVPLDALEPPIRRALEGEPGGHPVTIEGFDRRGRPIHCDVSCHRLAVKSGEAQVLLLMEERTRGTGVAVASESES